MANIGITVWIVALDDRFSCHQRNGLMILLLVMMLFSGAESPQTIFALILKQDTRLSPLLLSEPSRCLFT